MKLMAGLFLIVLIGCTTETEQEPDPMLSGSYMGNCEPDKIGGFHHFEHLSVIDSQIELSYYDVADHICDTCKTVPDDFKGIFEYDNPDVTGKISYMSKDTMIYQLTKREKKDTALITYSTRSNGISINIISPNHSFSMLEFEWYPVEMKWPFDYTDYPVACDI